MADRLPVDTGSAAVAALNPTARLDEPTPAVVVDTWNLAHPIGTWVVAYPGARGHRSLITQTRTRAFVTSSGKPAVALQGYASYILLTHVDVVTAERAGELLEQRHQLYDLDADSVCPYTGATTYPYLSPGGQS